MSQLNPDLSPLRNATPKWTIRRIFFGDGGLRAGWGLLLFFLLLKIVSQAERFLIRHLDLLPGVKSGVLLSLSPRILIVSDGLKFILLLAAVTLISLIERRSFARYGLALKRSLPDFVWGIAAGAGSIVLIVGANALTHTISFDGIALRGIPAARSALAYGLAFLCVGLLEEFLYRGYAQYTLTRGFAAMVCALAPARRDAHRIGFALAAFLVSGVIFAFLHAGNPGETPWGLAVVGLNGLVFAFSLYRTGTLWWAIGFHTAWNWTQTCFFGAPDSGDMFVNHLLNTHPIGSPLLSGGPNGPEGSLFALPVMLLVFVLVAYTLPRRDFARTAEESEFGPCRPDRLDDGEAGLPPGVMGVSRTSDSA
jgi:membrane protease YdiL (CAAX protease family)